jgi:diaminopimelate decarboxylase
MRHFAYRGGVLHAEDVNLVDLSEETGTPFYCYCEATIRRQAQRLRDAFSGVDPLIAYSVKANGALAVIKTLVSEGCGADVVSAGELRRALLAGAPANTIVFSGVGKTREEMAFALNAGIRQFNVESANELEALNAVGLQAGVAAPIAFRINPDVEAGGHARISTGKAGDKFGVAMREARALYAHARTLPGVRVVGVDCHIGSQIAAIDPFEAAFSRIAALIIDLRADGCAITQVDLGGGLGVSYKDGAPGASLADYAALVRRVIAPLELEIILEPGRFLVADAGALIARVVYDKASDGRRFLILDAGMNDLMRPALYDAHHEIWPIQSSPDAPLVSYDVVGPVCETTDIFARDRRLPEQKQGALVAFLTAGAYGAVLSSSYNARPLIPEILVSGAKRAIIRKRPSFEESTALESFASWFD